MKWLRRTCTVLILCAISVTVNALPPLSTVTKKQVISVQITDYHKFIDANNLLGFVANQGNLFYDASYFFDKNDGLYYPFTGLANILNHTNQSTVVFDAGLWMAGKVNGQLRGAIAEYSTEYVPGPMKYGTFQPDNAAFHVYKIYSDSGQSNPNQDFLNWPIDQGAPVDLFNNPKQLGTQTLFSVFNDADPSMHTSDAGSSAPLGVEVRQTVYATASLSTNGIINVRYDLFNKGANSITDCYVAFWADPDVGQSNNDLVASDTIRDIYYCYSSGIDNVYGSNSPAVGIQLIQGPVTPSPFSGAIQFGQVIPGYRNLDVAAFSRYINGTDPGNLNQTYNYMRGLNIDGSPYTYNGQAVPFMYSGDPVTGAGDIDVSPADRRMMVSVGPFNMNPGDSQQIMLRWGVGRGSNPINSITVLRNLLALHPQLLPTHSSLQFVGERDSLLPDPQYVSMVPVAGSIPSWTFTKSKSWLTVTQVQSAIKVSISTAALSVGMYYDTIVITSAGASNSPVRIPISYEVVADIPYCCQGSTGNVNTKGIIDLSDLTVLIDYLTKVPTPSLPCGGEANVNAIGIVDLTDLTWLITYLTVVPAPILPGCQ